MLDCRRVPESHGVNTTTVRIMTRRQNPRGTRTVSARVSLVVEEASKLSFDRMAIRAGYSSAGFYEAVVKHLESELTDRGVPSWLPQPEPLDGELPIEAA